MQRTLLLASILAAPTAAQSVWTVGPSNAQFTTIQAAVQAAVDGDVILVQPGTYSVAFTLNKGVAIIGRGTPLPIMNGRLVIQGIAAGRSVKLAGLTAGGGSMFAIDVLQCQGTVHCEAVNLSGVDVGIGGIIASAGLTVAGCPVVSLHRSTIIGWPGIQLILPNGSLVASDTAVNGVGSDIFYTNANVSREALTATGSRITLSSCQLQGGTSCLHCSQSVAAAVSCVACQVVAANTQFSGGSNFYGTAPGADLRSNSALIYDAACTFRGPIGGDNTRTVIARETGRVAGRAASPGTAATFTLIGPAGGMGALFLGFPAPPTRLPFGDVWLSLNAEAMLQLGSLPLPSTSVPIPLTVGTGLTLALQGGLLWQGTIQLSPPLVTIVP